MRKSFAWIAASFLLAVGANGCTALLTGGKREPEPEKTTYTESPRISTWTSTNESRASSTPTRS